MTNKFPEKKERLLSLILQDGILYRSATQPVRSRDGSPGRWMLDSLCVSLSHEGLQLAASCLLDLLARFEGRQIATYGVTAISLLAACVMQSNGRYEGLIVRKARKPHGSSKLIEGRINKDEPVIIIDDSVSSGISMQECKAALEAEGLRVEGGVCLVRFGWYGGYAQMQEQGHHMETLYDIDQDIISRMPDEPKPLSNPGKYFAGNIPWHEKTATEGSSPTALAREVLEEYLASGLLLKPPAALDDTYDHAGGCWVSIRQLDNIHTRHGRDGFWHFPGEAIKSAPENIVMACLYTARHLPKGEAGLALLEKSGIAITFFSKLQECMPGELDNNRYGIVVCSKERPEKMGGALPRMPGIATAAQQLHHAVRNNAGLISFEPYRIYRHEVQKIVEPGVDWQPTGAPRTESKLQWFESPVLATTLSRYIRKLIHCHFSGEALPEETLDNNLVPELDSLYVSILVQGKLLGCMGTKITRLDADVRLLAEAVLADQRFEQSLNADDLRSLVVKIALLHQPLELGAYQPDEVMKPVRFCEQALMVHQGGRSALFLPDVPVMFNYNEQQFIEELIDKAGITRPPYAWRRYECSSWLDDGEHVRQLQKGFPEPRTTPADVLENPDILGSLWAEYIQRQQLENGSFYFHYYPFQHQLHGIQDNARTAHTAWVLARWQKQHFTETTHEKIQATFAYLKTSLRKTARKTWLSDAFQSSEIKNDTIAGTSLLLMFLSSYPELTTAKTALAEVLAETLWQAIDQHGRIHCFIHDDAEASEDAADLLQDYLPTTALLALALACQAGFSKPDRQKLSKALRFYWHRFQYKQRPAQVSWLVQAWFAWYQIAPSQTLADQLLVACDSLLPFSYEQHGGIITRQETAGLPDYMTAVYLEALAIGLQVAKKNADSQRAERYEKACSRGFAFLDSLTVQQHDKQVLPQVEWAKGGLRQSPVNSMMRLDFTQHALSAVLYLGA